MKGTSPTRERARPARHRSAKIEVRFFNVLDERISGYDHEIEAQARLCEPAQRLMKILELQPRRRYYRMLVAIANKNARITWALLAKNESLRSA